MYIENYLKVFENNLQKNKFLFCLQKSYAVKLISTRMISLDYLRFLLKPLMKQNVSETA